MSDRHIEKCLLCFLWHSIPHKLFYHNLTTHLLLGILGFFPKYFAIMNDAGNNPCYLAVTTHIHSLLLRWSGPSTTQLGLHFPDSLADGCDHVTTFQSRGICGSHVRPFQLLHLCTSTGAHSFPCPFTSSTCKGCRYGGRKKKKQEMGNTSLGQ